MALVRLLKSWRNEFGIKTHLVGTVLNMDNNKASEMIADKIAEIYNGEYPPKQKQKIELKNLNSK